MGKQLFANNASSKLFTLAVASTNKITVAKGASNGYGLDTAGDTWSVPLSPGEWMMVGTNGASPTIGSGAKVIDVTGTGSQALNVAVVMG